MSPACPPTSLKAMLSYSVSPGSGKIDIFERSNLNMISGFLEAKGYQSSRQRESFFFFEKLEVFVSEYLNKYTSGLGLFG